jgi:hypothetical protein
MGISSLLSRLGSLLIEKFLWCKRWNLRSSMHRCF